MKILFENLPYIWLMWIGLGFVIILVGIIMIAQDKTEEPKKEEKHNIDFSSFLSILKEKEEVDQLPLIQDEMQNTSNTLYVQIIDLYRERHASHEIAKILGVGVGEVELILSLYKME